MAARLDREGARLAVDLGSLRLRGIAAALRRLADEVGARGADPATEEWKQDEERGLVLELLARDVDLEAAAMAEVEVFLMRSSEAAA